MVEEMIPSRFIHTRIFIHVIKRLMVVIKMIVLSIESTSNISTLTSDELPCFDAYSTSRDRVNSSFSGKSLFTMNPSFGYNDDLVQDPFFSNQAYGCYDTSIGYSNRRPSYDFGYPPGLGRPSFDSEDGFDSLYSHISPDLSRSYIDYQSMMSTHEGETVIEEFKPYSTHYSLLDQPYHSTYSFHSEHSNSFDGVPVCNSVSLKREESHMIDSSSPPFCPSHDAISISSMKGETLSASTSFYKNPKSIETMSIHSSTLPPLSKSHHKVPFKKAYPEVSDEAPGNPDEIDPSINPRIFSGKKPKKNMDYSRYIIDINKVKSGEDSRLTLMLKNIPNGFTQSFLLEVLDSFVKNQYDFFYMPVDFKTNCNLGFGYVSMINTQSVVSLYNALNHKRWPNTPSTKICEVNYARMQGRSDMQKLCKDWAIMQLPEKYRPVFFEKTVIRKQGKEIVVMKRTTRPL